jgi:hypothetical protein
MGQRGRTLRHLPRTNDLSGFAPLREFFPS